MKRLLVVDWDYFYPRGFEMNDEYCAVMEARGDSVWNYDWGHQENGMFIEMMWPIRASGFMRRGVDPLPSTTGEEITFWEQFSFAGDVEVFVGESNSYAAHPFVTGEEGSTDINEVWLYDAHHDCGYRGHDPHEVVEKGEYECGNWMMLYWSHGARLYVRYPTWAEWKKREFRMDLPKRSVNRRTAAPTNGPKGPIDRVFICRSGAWVPPWVDEKFIDFVHACPNAGLSYTVINGEPYNPMEVRKFSLEEAKAYTDSMRIAEEAREQAGGS
jgi:hypothetical protein